MGTTSARPWRRIARDAAVVVGLIFAAYLFVVSAGQKGSMAFDVVAYWQLDLADPYTASVGDLGFFPYSPAIALLFAPFTNLPWLVFVSGWYTVLIGAVAWLGRRNILTLLAFPPVAIELYHGNIHLLLAVAIVIGFRYPAAWAFVLLTKVTPGIGLLWFAARGEWRKLGAALGVTAAIVAVTFVLLPTQWMAWIQMLLGSAGTPPPWPALPVPLWLRLPVAALIVIWGARTDRMWAVPVAAALSLPALWPGGLAILAACWRLGPARARLATAPADYHAPDAVRPDDRANAPGLAPRARPA